MKIFVIFLLIIGNLIGIKNKVHVHIKIHNFKVYIEIKGKFINIKKEETIRKDKTKKVDIELKNILKVLKNVEIEKLNIKVLFGAIFLLPTVFAVPIISSLLEYIKILPFKKLENYKYTVTPTYNEPKLIFELDLIMKIRVFDLVKYKVVSIKDYLK